MKNSKKIKTVLIVSILVLTLIICFNVGVYAAYALAATDVNYTKPDGTQTSVKAALDEVYAKVPTREVGDEVTVGGEQFYVLEWDNNCDTVNLIAKYNLDTTGTKQQDAPNSTTKCVFSSANYWRGSYTSSPFNLNDFMGFTETDAIGKAKSYGRSKDAVASRLMSYQEAKKLETKAASNTKVATMLWGRANSTDGYLNYWLSSTCDIDGIWNVVNNHFGTDYWGVGTAVRGLRPVITVLKTDIS